MPEKMKRYARSARKQPTVIFFILPRGRASRGSKSGLEDRFQLVQARIVHELVIADIETVLVQGLGVGEVLVIPVGLEAGLPEQVRAHDGPRLYLGLAALRPQALHVLLVLEDEGQAERGDPLCGEVI